VRAASSNRTPVKESPGKGPPLAPCLLLRKGKVCLPGPDGPVPALRGSGGEFDVFDILDQLSPRYSFLYLADLDGIEQNDPQVEYIQELSREMPMWVDAGVRRADQAIDIIVAGAQKAVLSSSYLDGPRELRRAWKLSTEIVFEIETVGPRLSHAAPAWEPADPLAVVSTAREIGVSEVVVSPRETDPDWSLIATVAKAGRTWVDGTFDVADVRRLAESGAVGGIFHIDRILASMDAQGGADEQ
jgi:phosphoribosylformimino-5-aminoimidazole carboxamide ribonucleotide (ProFAR) isomerase